MDFNTSQIDTVENEPMVDISLAVGFILNKSSRAQEALLAIENGTYDYGCLANIPGAKAYVRRGLTSEMTTCSRAIFELFTGDERRAVHCLRFYDASMAIDGTAVSNMDVGVRIQSQIQTLEGSDLPDQISPIMQIVERDASQYTEEIIELAHGDLQLAQHIIAGHFHSLDTPFAFIEDRWSGRPILREMILSAHELIATKLRAGQNGQDFIA